MGSTRVTQLGKDVGRLDDEVEYGGLQDGSQDEVFSRFDFARWFIVGFGERSQDL